MIVLVAFVFEDFEAVVFEVTGAGAVLSNGGCAGIACPRIIRGDQVMRRVKSKGFDELCLLMVRAGDAT